MLVDQSIINNEIREINNDNSIVSQNIQNALVKLILIQGKFH